MKEKQLKSILYVHHDMGKSGASRSLSFLLDKLDTNQFSAKVHCIFGGPVVDLFKEKNIEVLSERGIYPFHGSTVTGMNVKLFLTNLVRLPQSLYNAIKLVRNVKPDLIHLNSSCLFIVALAAKLVDKNIKVLCHVREPLLQRSIAASIMRFCNHLFVDQFVAIDEFTGGSMKYKGKLQVVYNAVNLEDYHNHLPKDRIRSQFKLNATAIVFLYLARISKSNGTLSFVDVANQLTKEYKNFHFVVAGFTENRKDSYSQKVQKAAWGNENIHLMAFQHSIPTLIAGADVMVVPFTQPHFARSIVEAASIGIPSIGANIGGVNELIIDKKTGLLFNSPQELYTQCVLLGTNDHLRNILGNEALQFAKARFDNNESSKRVFKIYNDLLKQA